MKRSLVLILCLFGALLRITAQTLPATSASISGMVTKEPGSQPLNKATIQVIAEDQSKGSNYTATTDPDGHFLIEKVAAGRYHLFVEKTGFVEINPRGRKSEGRFLTVLDREQVQDVLIRMLSTAVISGRILDEDGDPMSGVLVMVQKRKPGRTSRLETAGQERTNDLGEYRFYGLFPGQYLIAAVPPPDFHDYERQHEPSPDEIAKPDTRYLTTYYPGTYDFPQASIISLHAGDELPINLTLARGRTYRIRGLVTGIPAGQKAVVEITAKTNQSLLQSTDVAPDGQFEVRGVAPGSYVVRATVSSDAQTMTTHQNLSVAAADVDGIKLVPMRSFTVTGNLRIEGRPVQPMTQYSLNLYPIAASVDPGPPESLNLFGANASVDRAGNFQWTNINSGTYFVKVLGGADLESFLKSVTLGEHNLDTGVTLNGPAALDLILNTKGSTVEGAVVDHDQPVPNATIVAVPEEKYRKLTSRFGVATSDQNGHFIIRGLAPGTYTAFAWQDIEPELIYDPDFLKSQESNATPLKVEEGSRKKVQLKVSDVAEEWR